MYGLEKIHKYWLFYGEYYPGVITLNTKPFSFYVDASKYDPERLLFNVDRNLLISSNTDGSKNVPSPESFIKDPEKWLQRAIAAIFQQNKKIACCKTDRFFSSNKLPPQ